MINEAELQSLVERASNAPLDDKDNCFICYEAANVILYLYAKLQQSNKTWNLCEVKWKS